MSQALIFLGTGYEEVEMLTVVDMLRRADISIDMVSITGAREVTSSHKVTITADKLLEEVDFSAADMLILPGGIPGTPNLRSCETLCRQLKTFATNGKWVAAVCAAPTILGELEILKGKKATCYPSFSDKLATGDYVKQPVVVDGHVITSRGMGTCIEFAGAIIEALKDKATADAVKQAIIYNDTY
jgi:4-methyl-5(b-hydroxyethyl)-thiazole monophosphate biosynthesis